MTGVIDKLTPFMTKKTYKAKAPVTQDLAVQGTLFILTDGLVVIETCNAIKEAEGKHDRAVGTLRAAQAFIGLEFLFAREQQRNRVGVRAVRDSEIYLLPFKQLSTLLSSELSSVKPYLVESMLTQLADYYNTLHRRLERQAMYLPEDRVADTFDYISGVIGEPHRFGTEVRLPTNVLYKLSGDSERSFQVGSKRLLDSGHLVKAGKESWVICK